MTRLHTPNKADERRARIVDDPEAMAAVKVLQDGGYMPGTVADYMCMLDLHSKPDEVRVLDVTSHGQVLHTVECGITFYLRHGYVWCVKSSTQCDYCGPVAKWKPPTFEHPLASAIRLASPK